MRTEAELEQRHEATVKRFPGGMSLDQFRLVVLESADEADNGRVYVPSIAVPGQPLAQTSLMIGMWFDGLLVHHDDGSGRPVMHQPMRYRISDKGREWLRAYGQSRTEGMNERS